MFSALQTNSKAHFLHELSKKFTVHFLFAVPFLNG